MIGVITVALLGSGCSGKEATKRPEDHITASRDAAIEKEQLVSPYKRIRLQIACEERFVFRDESPAQVLRATVMVDLEVSQLRSSVGVGLPLDDKKTLWFELGARPLGIAKPDPDIGDPATDLMLSVEVRGDWVDSFADITDIQSPVGSLVQGFAPGETQQAMRRQIDATDEQGRKFTQNVTASVTFVGPSPDSGSP